MTNSWRLRHFTFSQSSVRPRAVGCRGALGDDAFEVVLAGLGEEGRALALHMIGVANRAAFRQARDERRQQRLALDQRQAGEIAAVEMQQIEDVIGQPLGLAARERILQSSEAGDAILAHHRDLAVQISGADLGQRQGRGDRPEARRPVEAAAGEHADLAGLEAGRRAVAVQLDLVDPVIAGRRLVREGGELGRDEFGQGRGWAELRARHG